MPPLPMLVALASLLALAGPAGAWSPVVRQTLAFEAARLAPPDLYRQLVRNRESFALGVRTAAQSGTGERALEDTAADAIRQAILAIEQHRPFNDVAYRLGLVAHHLVAANNPLATADDDPEEARFAADFARYLESAQPRVRRVFYGFRPDLRDARSLLRTTLARGRTLYPLVGREYRRVGFRPGHQAFDDRSTAYAVAALASNHAVSDIADALRYIWLAAGGIDSRHRLPLRGDDPWTLPSTAASAR